MSESTALQAYEDRTSAYSLLLEGQHFDRMQAVAEMMAAGKATIPQHLRGNKADCLAITMQAIRWGMDPFVVASKTHVTQGGQLGYEAQLINAVCMSLGAFKDEPTYEYFGDWNKILGRVKEMKSDKGGKYYVADWDPKDEEGLGVKVSVTLRSGRRTELTLLLKQCWPRFSTQWATDPQMQIAYAAVRKLARRDAPTAILGVYAIDELEDVPPREKFMGAADVVGNEGHRQEPPKKLYFPDDEFEKSFPGWKRLIETNKKPVEAIIKTAETLAELTEAQKSRLMAIKPAIDVTPITESSNGQQSEGQAGSEGGAA